MTDIDYLRNHLTEGQIWGQLAEEAAELAQAALKMQRICDKTNPPRKTAEECRQAVIEEKADVEGCFTLLAWYPSDEIIAAKMQRWRKHLESAENAIQETTKKAWHDLRKNPEDLPPLHYDVFFTDIDGFYYMGHTYQCCENCPIAWASNGQDDRIKNVIAWHEIEPFEGVENATQETPPELVRTCREVVEQQIPEYIDADAFGGVVGCPQDCFPDAISLCGAEYGVNDEMCTECWNQPYPGDEK